MPKAQAAHDQSGKIEEFIDLSSLGDTWHDGLLILMYHAIEAQTPGAAWMQLYVDPAKFREQIRELLSSGARFISADEMIESNSRDRQVLITLDDGFQNVFQNALPVLRELNVPAIAYIVAGQIGGSNVWDHPNGLLKRPLMTREEIIEWVDAGLEIGAHTMTHCHLATVPLAKARSEIFDSKKILEDLIGRPVRHFCYPYGNMNKAVRELVIEAGYETATSCKVGFNYPETDRFTLQRLMARQ